MCWSGEASAVLAMAGFGTAAYVAKKGESKELWIPLTYFACMELLQAATYIYINLCDAPPEPDTDPFWLSPHRLPAFFREYGRPLLYSR